MNEPEPCVFCGGTGPLADPAWDGPRAHLSCFFKVTYASPGSYGYPKELHLFAAGSSVADNDGAQRSGTYVAIYNKGMRAAKMVRSSVA